MLRALISTAAACAALAGLCLVAPVTANAQSITLSNASCPNGYTLSGVTNGLQTLSCGGSGPPTGCSISGPTSATINTQATLTAVCSGGGAATSWSWSGGNCGGQTGQACQATSASAGGVGYSVTPSNGSGAGNLASTTVTWTSGSVPPPSGCLLSGTAVGSSGGATTLTVTCSGGGAPTSYAWTASTPPSSGWSATTSTNTQSPTIATSTTFTATPSNGGGNGNTASASVSVGGGGGGGISCPGASSTVVFDENWANPTQIHTTGIHEQDVVVVRFTPTGANTVGYNFSQISAGTGDQTNRTTVLSPTACDFSTPPVLQWNAWQNGNTATTLFSIGPNNIGYPALTAGTTYYLNIKNSPGTCPGGCDMYIQLNATSH